MSEDESSPAFQTVYGTPELVQHMIENAIWIHDVTEVQRFIADRVNKEVYHLFKDANGMALAGLIKSNTKCWESCSEGIIAWIRDDLIDNKIRRLPESKDFTKHVSHQPIQPRTFTAPATTLVKQYAEITVVREARFQHHNTEQEPNAVSIPHRRRLLVAL